jgi:hypothetical protein
VPAIWSTRLPAVLVAAGALLAGTIGLAGPAAAIDDPRRPSAAVTHGPSCGPSVVRVAVTNGTQPHRVTLVFHGTAVQASAELAAAEQAELASEELEWGETVDVSLTITGADGTVEAPIEFGTYTRPSAEDCAAATAPPSGAGPTPTTSTPSPTSSTSATPTDPSSSTSAPTPEPGPEPEPELEPEPVPGTPTSESRPAPSTPPRTSTPAPAVPGTVEPTSAPPSLPTSDDRPRPGSGSSSVSPGGVVTVRATGFTPGEAVTVSLLGTGGPLTTVIAARDGSVQAVVQIPRRAALGTATVQLVGASSSASAGLDLQVAARTQPLAEQPTSVPLLAAGIGLIGAAGVLGLLAARRSRTDRTTMPR